ncbi:MAG: tetratricopeptide repeat protein, partial [Maribacter sp.]
SSPYFFLDAYEFFYNQGEIKFSDEVIGKGFKTLFDKNPVVLKALAYMYQEQGRFDKANEALRQVFILRPNYAQSYFDLANSYRDISDYDFSAELYTRYDYLIKAGFFESDTISFNKLIKKEFTNLVALHKDELLFVKKTRLLDTNNSNEPTTRIVFEWNDSQAEFNLEFLQENNEYYVWNHNYDENPEDINREKKYGYNVAEYIIGNTGHYKPWQISIEYLGNKSLTPTYLKITRYHNYGSKSQNKEVKVFKLTIKDIKQKLLSF